MNVGRRSAIAFVLGLVACVGCSPLQVAETSGSAPAPVVASTVSAAGCPYNQHEPLPEWGIQCTASTPPEGTQRVAPQYPDDARERHIDGTVIVAALVCEHGRVLDTRIRSSVPGLNEAAEAAVRQWIFEPARSGARAVSCWTDVPVKFSLH